MKRHHRWILRAGLLPCALAPLLPLAACIAEAPAAGPAPAAADSAGPPTTDIFLLDFREHDGTIQLGAPRNITDRAGYDNQPAFVDDGRAVLYTSIRADGQADVYRFDIVRGSTERVTRTPESEYSPTPLPAGPGFSAVRVEMDSTQRLWRFGPDGSDPRPVLADIAPVGYHAWVDQSTLALFVLGEPPTLRLADTRTGRAETVAEGIGRALHRVPGRSAVSFVDKSAEDDWWIRELELDTRRITPIARTLPDVEDLAWTPGGALLMGSGPVLYRWNAEAEEWWEVADLEAAGVRGITRIAVSPRGDRVALVGRRE